MSDHDVHDAPSDADHADPAPETTMMSNKELRVAAVESAERAATISARAEEAAEEERQEAANDRVDAAADRAQMITLLTRIAGALGGGAPDGARATPMAAAHPNDGPGGNLDGIVDQLDAFGDLGADLDPDMDHAFGLPHASRDNSPRASNVFDEDARRDHAKARRAAQRKEWDSAPRRAHWFVVGAMPTDHTQSVLQSNLGEGTLVSTAVHRMLSSLSNFAIKEFGKRGGAPGKLPIDQRAAILCKSLAHVMQRSLPVDDATERRGCESRLLPLFQSFRAFVKALDNAASTCPRAIADPDCVNELEVMIDRDFLVWSDSISNAAAGAARSNSGMPPTSVHDLPPLPAFTWANLSSFLASNHLLRLNTQLATRPTARAGARAAARPKSKDICRNFNAGKCNRGSRCHFVHEYIDKSRAKRTTRDGGGAGVAGASGSPKRTRKADAAAGGTSGGDGTGTSGAKAKEDE